MTEWLVDSLKNIPVVWQVFLLSMLPVTELRAAIPIGIVQGLSPLTAMVFAIGGNLIPVVPVLGLLEPVSKILSKFKPLGLIMDKIFARTRAKSNRVEKYGALGLLLFVGIPAPGTGVWSGSLLAFLLGIPFWKAFWPIVGGAALAGIIVTLISLGVITLFAKGFGLLLVFGILVYILYRLKFLRKGR